MNKMVMAVVQRDLTESILSNLLNSGFTATFNESRGGMLRQSQNSLYIAVAEEQLHEVLEIIRDTCSKHNESSDLPNFEEDSESPSDNIQSGGAVVFIWDIDQMERY